MATTDPKKQIFSLIRDFASEKSHGERRVAGLKKRIEELRIELDTANLELEEAKRLKESSEQEFKGYEVEYSLNVSSVQALEARICSIQDDISSVGSEVDRLKSKEDAMRDEFINRMVEFNTAIRALQATKVGDLPKECCLETAAGADNQSVKELPTNLDTNALEEKLKEVAMQTAKEEQKYLTELDTQKKLQQEYEDLQGKVCLMEVIMKESKALQDLMRQTSELEQTCASLGEELTKRCACPSCHADNMATLAEILQANEANG